MNSSQHVGHAPGATDARNVVLPVPTLDHVIVNVRDRMEHAAEQYRRLGFTITPLGRHTLGSINHLVILGTDYLELLAVPPGDGGRTDVLDWPTGLNGVAFGCSDADALYANLAAAGAPVLSPLAFSRPVELSGDTRDAAFRVVRIDKPAVASGRMFFCHHLTRDLVWRDEWRRHANGVLGIAGVVIAADEPVRLGRLFHALFGGDAVMSIPDGLRLCMGLTWLDVVSFADLARRFGEAAPARDGRAEVMAALSLRTFDLRRADAALAAGGVRFTRESGRVLVPATEAFGVALEFSA